jgi:hypothetical protein
MIKGELRQRIESMGLLYAPQTELPPQIIDQYGEYAVRRIWRILIFQREHDFRISTSVSHGDHLPADYVAYANRARATSPNRSFADIPVNMIGTRKHALYNKATTGRPDVYIADQKIYFLPDSTMIDPSTSSPYGNIGGVDWFYYQRPPKLFGDTILDSTDIGLPDFACLWAVQVAFTYCLIHMMSAAKRSQYTERLRQENIKSVKQFLTLARGLQEKTPSATNLEKGTAQ